jgi:hypothetical protein
MTAAELQRRIHDEIGSNWDRTNAHGCDLRACLVDPVKLPYEDITDSATTVYLWLVLRESPADHSGYMIVFDEIGNRFGLACRFDSGRDGYLGPYGETFLAAFEAM